MRKIVVRDEKTEDGIIVPECMFEGDESMHVSVCPVPGGTNMIDCYHGGGHIDFKSADDARAFITLLEHALDHLA